MRTLILASALLLAPLPALADVSGGCGGGGAPAPDDTDTDTSMASIGLVGGGLLLLGTAGWRRRRDEDVRLPD